MRLWALPRTEVGRKTGICPGSLATGAPHNKFAPVRRTLIRLILAQPWGLPFLIVLGLAIVAGFVWYYVQETKVKEAERKRDRDQSGSIWDD